MKKKLQVFIFIQLKRSFFYFLSIQAGKVFKKINIFFDLRQIFVRRRSSVFWLCQASQNKRNQAIFKGIYKHFFSFLRTDSQWILIIQSATNMERRKKDSQANLSHLMEDAIEDSDMRRGKKKLAFKKWNSKENIKYAHFLQIHKEEMEDETSRRNFQVFKFMARLLFKRNAEQCRTHHQKMIQRHGDIQGIINHFLPLHQKLEDLEEKCTPLQPSFKTQNDSLSKESTFEDKYSEIENLGFAAAKQEEEEWCKYIEYIFEPKIETNHA